MPNPTQRAYIERRVAELELLAQPGPVKEIDATIGAVMLRYATARQDDDMMRARVEGYRIVLRDFPAWCVREAYARWLKGEIGQQHDASFPPPERVLHECAKGLLAAAMGQRIGLQMVLDAEGYQPPTEAEMAERRKHLHLLTQNIANAASPEDRGPGKPKRQAETSDDQARKDRILNNPSKGILAGLREMQEVENAAAE
ncbi:hypothetical protein [Microvirga sp. BSC39]|uniref:hypothetical protein n=1 Tax=Microvirga sp. BSC39 TaxID=1549810 RepID=UPI001269B17F|nr:hypothetical protein [Microvirga sp. BSC39]